MNPPDLQRIRNAMKELKASVKRRQEQERRLSRAVQKALTTNEALLRSLIARRQSLGIGITEVASRMKIPASNVARLEGAGYNPTLATLCRYAAAIGVELGLRALPGDWSKPHLDLFKDEPVDPV